MKKILNGGLLVLFAGVAVLYFLLNPDETEFFPRCLFHSLTGYYCPGCGSQRAIHYLLHLRLGKVTASNLLVLPAFMIIAYHYLHPLLNKKLNRKLPNILYLQSTPWVIFLVIILFWILRNIPVFPFYFLAPGAP